MNKDSKHISLKALKDNNKGQTYKPDFHTSSAWRIGPTFQQTILQTIWKDKQQAKQLFKSYMFILQKQFW